jgi:hypothetical protein
MKSIGQTPKKEELDYLKAVLQCYAESLTNKDYTVMP